MRGKVTEKERDRHRNFAYADSFPKCLNNPVLILGTRNSVQIFHIAVGTQPLVPLLLPLRVCISHKPEIGIELGHADMGGG